MNQKKLGILTFHRALNYGAVLQAYALKSVCEDLGASVRPSESANSANCSRAQGRSVPTIGSEKEIIEHRTGAKIRPFFAPLEIHPLSLPAKSVHVAEIARNRHF